MQALTHIDYNAQKAMITALLTPWARANVPAIWARQHRDIELGTFSITLVNPFDDREGVYVAIHIRTGDGTDHQLEGSTGVEDILTELLGALTNIGTRTDLT